MYQKNRSWILKHLDFTIIDVIVCEVAFLLAFMLRQGGGVGELLGSVFTSDVIGFDKVIYRDLFFIILFLCVFDILALHSHKNIIKRGILKEAKSCFQLCFAIFVELLFILVAFKISQIFSRLVLYYFFVFSFALTFIFRCCYKQILKAYLGTDHYHKRHFIVVAFSSETEQIAQEFATKQEDVQISGWVIPDEGAGEISGAPIVACDVASTIEYLKSHWVDEVFISRGMSTLDKINEFIGDCRMMGITTHQVLDIKGDTSYDMTVEPLAGEVVITSSLRIIDPLLLFIKRVIDIIGSLFGLVFCGIFMVIIVIPGILINDPGPIFYKQKRVGKNGRIFNLYKFRSMYMDADKRKAALMEQNEMNGAIFKMKNDPRIIGSGPDGTKHGYGWFIRKTSIDEFPQFLNVFLGQMSLVGTRPPTVDEWQQYEAHHRARLAVRPGITGVWQTSGRNEVSDFEQIVNLDLSYINNFSIGNDIRIIWKTMKQVFKGDGAE